MTPKYWTGIVAGMLAIFVVGMLVGAGIEPRQGVRQQQSPGVAAAAGDAGFRVDGDRLGDIQRLQFMRSQPRRGRLGGAHGQDRRTLPTAAVALVHAAGRPTPSRSAVAPASSACRAADSAQLELVPFGHVEFQPTGKQRDALYVARDVDRRYARARLSRHGEPAIPATSTSRRRTTASRSRSTARRSFTADGRLRDGRS